MGGRLSCTKRKQSQTKKIYSLERHKSSSDLDLTSSVSNTITSNLDSPNVSCMATTSIQNHLDENAVDNDTEQPLLFEPDDRKNIDSDLLGEQSTPEKRRNLENFVIIWLDECAVDNQLRYAVRAEVNHLEIFDDVDRCVGRIYSIDTEKIFVIVSRAYYGKIALLLEWYEQVQSIYIFCSNQNRYELYKKEHSIWKQYKKIMGVFSNISDICTNIKQNIQHAPQTPKIVSIPQRDLTVEGRSSGIDKLEASFMYSQLIKEILITIPLKENPKKDLITLLRSSYDGNEVGMQRIDEFEHDYRPNKAIRWYTKEYFLYGTLNKALRTQDIDTLYKMGFFITDIHHQLKQLRAQSVYRFPFEVYRGQCVSQEDFQAHSRNVGGLISFSSLLSCSRDIKVARAYAVSHEQRKDMVSILLQITVDPNVRSTSFADVTDCSYYGDKELEFLFSMGTIFRIRSIRPLKPDSTVQLFDLLLTNDEDIDLRNLREHMRQEIGGTNNLINFGRLLIEMGNLNQSEQFYKIVLQETSVQDNPRTTAMIYNDLGVIASQRNFKEQALKLYKTALNIGHERFPLQDAQLSSILNNIGEIYLDLRDFDKAEENFEEALKIDIKVIPPNVYNQAIRYHNIGMVYKEKQNFQKALKNFSKSLELKQSTLPPIHPSIAISNRSIGDIYRAQGRFAEALKLCKKALEIETNSLLPYHLSLSMTHRCIALIYYDQRRFNDALNEMTTARDIARKTLPATHPSMIEMKNEITMINEKISRMLRNETV